MRERPIAWYRDFHDVPRLVAIREPDGYWLLDCAFDDALDDYPDDFTVKWIPSSHERSPEDLIELARALAPLAQIATSALTFDESRRRFVTLALPPR